MIEVTHNQASQPSLAEGAIQTSNHAVAQQEQVVIQAPTSDRKHPTLPQRARAYSEVVSAAVPVVHAMKPTKNENNVSPNEDGDQCEKKAISPTATTNSNVSTDVAETAPSSTVSSRKHALNTSYKHTPPYVMRNADATASSPTFDIHSFLCTANTTMWVEWLTQGGDLNGFDMNFYSTDDVDWMDDPLRTIPFPRWMSHGISKYLLLSLDTMLHLELIQYAGDDQVFSDAAVKPYADLHSALQQSIWLAIVWWQSQLFDSQLRAQLYQTIDRTASDRSLCDAIQLESPSASVGVSQLMLDAIPHTVDAAYAPPKDAGVPSNSTSEEPRTIHVHQHTPHSTTFAPVMSYHEFIKNLEALMDMRGWSLSKMARNTLCIQSIRTQPFWIDIPIYQPSTLKGRQLQLVLLPGLCSVLRRMNLLETVFYGYDKILAVIERWRDAIYNYMQEMEQNEENYERLNRYDETHIATLERKTSSYSNYLLSQILLNTSKEDLPTDARFLFSNVHMGVLEHCALVAYQCDVDSWNTARQAVDSKSSSILLACFVRAAAVLREKARDKTTLQDHSLLLSYHRGWCNIDHLLPRRCIPILGDACISEFDLRPKSITASRWVQLLAEKRHSAPVHVVNGRIHTLPVDLAHLLASTIHCETQPHHHMSLLMTTPDKPDLLLHYDHSSHTQVPKWTLVYPNHFNQPPWIMQFSQQPQSQQSSSSSQKVFSKTSFQSRVQKARGIAAQLMQVIPPSYMFSKLHVHAATLDASIYARVTHDNLAQHVVRTMPYSNGGV
jgi:hypothetical protein